MKYLLAAITTLVLTACGGGGGGGATAVAPADLVSLTRNTTPASGYIVAAIDLRFDLANPTIDGYPFPEHIDSIKKYINHFQTVGYNAVRFQTNVPISLTTGQVQTNQTNCSYQCDHKLPMYFWDAVLYAKQNGLKVFIDAQIVDVETDMFISPVVFNHTPPPGMSWSDIWRNASDYQVTLAKKAESYKVDGFYVGNFNLGLDTESYRTMWQTHVDRIRSNFKGILLYSSCSQCTSVVWQMVDQLDVFIDPVLSQNKILDSAQITSLYRSSNTVSQLQNLYRTYNKPMVLRTTINLGDKSTGQTANPSLLITPAGNGVYGNGYAAGVNYVSLFEKDYVLQVARITGFMDMIVSDLKGMVVAAAVNGYNPWQTMAWLNQPCAANDYTCVAWQTYTQIADDLWLDSPAESAILAYRNKLY